MVVYEPIIKVNLERTKNGVSGFTRTLFAKDIITPDQYTKAASITVDQYLLHNVSINSRFYPGVYPSCHILDAIFFRCFTG